MESGFRRETFGPGEGREMASDRVNAMKQAERKIFENRLISEGLGARQEGNSDQNLQTENSPKPNFGEEPVQKQWEEHRENKFGVVRRSQEKMGLKQVTELEEEKSLEGDRSGAISPDEQTVDIKIVRYERTDSDGEDKVVDKGSKTRGKKGKTGSKGKDLKRRESSGTKFRKDRGSKTGSGKVGGKGKSGAKKGSRRGSKSKGVGSDRKGKADAKKKEMGKRRGSKRNSNAKGSVTSKTETRKRSGSKSQNKNGNSKAGQMEIKNIAEVPEDMEGGTTETVKVKKRVETIKEDNMPERDENGKLMKTTTTTKTVTTITTTEKVIQRKGGGGGQGGENSDNIGGQRDITNEGNGEVERAGAAGGGGGGSGGEILEDPQTRNIEIHKITETTVVHNMNQNDSNKGGSGGQMSAERKGRGKEKEKEKEKVISQSNSRKRKLSSANRNSKGNNVVVVKTKKKGNQDRTPRKKESKLVIEVDEGELDGGNDEVKKKRKRKRSPPGVQKMLDSEERKRKRRESDVKKPRGVEVKKRKTKVEPQEVTSIQVNIASRPESNGILKDSKRPKRAYPEDKDYLDKAQREQEKVVLGKHIDKDIRPLKFSPQKNLKFNKDRLLDSSEPPSINEEQTIQKSIPGFSGDITEKQRDGFMRKTNKKVPDRGRKTDSSGKNSSRSKNIIGRNQPGRSISPLTQQSNATNNNSKKSQKKSRPKKEKSRPRTLNKVKGDPKNEESDYSWKQHRNLRNEQPIYKFENPRPKTQKILISGGGPIFEKDNYSNTGKLSAGKHLGADAYKNPYDRKEYVGANARSATGPLRAKEYRIKLSEIKRPQTKPKMKTMGQLRRDRMKQSSQGPAGRIASDIARRKASPKPEMPRGAKVTRSMKSSGKVQDRGRPARTLERSLGATPKKGFNDDIKFRRSPDVVRSGVVGSKQDLGNLDQDFTTFNRKTGNNGLLTRKEARKPPAETIGTDMSQKIQRQMNTQKLDNMGPLEEEFFEDMGEVKNFLRQREYARGAARLDQIKDKYRGRAQVEIYKLLAMLSFKASDYPAAIGHITQCLDLVSRQHIPDKKALQRGLIFNLIVVYIQLKNFKGALALIEEMEDFPVVEALARTPAQSRAYLSSLKGDCLLGLKRPAEAAPCLEEYFKALLRKEVTQSNVAEMLGVINKIIVSLSEAGDHEQMKNFVTSSIKIFEKMVEVTRRQGVKEFITRDFLEKLLLDLMDIFYLRGEYSLLLELIKKSSTERYFGTGSVVPDEQRLKVGHLTVKLANKLRAEPAGRELLPLKDAINLLKYGKTLLKKVAPGEEKDRLELLLTFNLGVYYLEKEDFFKSKTLFDKCLEKYPRLMGTTDHKFYRILYNIGLSLYNLKKFEDSLHFFEKVHRELSTNNAESAKNNLEEGATDLQRPEETELLLRVTKILAKIYYRLGKYSECHSVLHSYITKSLDKDQLPEGFFKYLTMYYLSCLRLKSTDFHEIFQKVLQVVQDPKNSQFAEAQQYFNLFYQMGRVSLAQSDFPEHEQYKDFLERLVETRETPEKFISILNLMYSKFAKDEPSEALEMNLDLIKMLRQKDLTISENAQKIENFLFNFLFILVHKLNTSGEDSKLGPEAVGLLDQIRTFKEQHRIYDKIYELLRDKEYNSLYNSKQDHGHSPPLSDSHLAEAQARRIQDETLDGTDFTITDAPPLDSAPFSDQGTFRVMGPRIPAKARSETYSEKGRPEPRRTEPRPPSQNKSNSRVKNRTPSDLGNNPNQTNDYDMIYEELIAKARVSDTEEKERFARSPRSPPTRNQRSPPRSNKKPRVSKKNKYGAGSRQPRDNSVEFVKKNNLQRKRCVCVGDLAFKWDIVKHIDEFFSNLKSMNFLGLGSEIDKYFQRFISLIREKNLNWQKFRYVKQLLDFYLEQEHLKRSMWQKSQGTPPPRSRGSNMDSVPGQDKISTSKQGDLAPKVDLILSEMKASETGSLKTGSKLPSRGVSTLLPQKSAQAQFERLVESIIIEVRPCVHDYRLMLVLLESFQKDEYLTLFLTHLHKHHREIASMIFNLLFLEDHERKLAQVYKTLFRKMFAKKQYMIKNSWMHNIVELDSGSAIKNIGKSTLNTLYIKRRYLWLADPANETLARKHVMAQDMLVFKLRFSCYQSLVYLLKFSPQKRAFLFKTHLIHLNSLFPKLQKKALNAQVGHIMHDLLALAFFAEPDTADNVRDLETALEMLRAECDYVQLYKFSIMTSQLAKGLFRRRLYQESLRFFTKAYYAFKGSSNKDRGAFPPFMPRTLPKNFFFNILCFITICNFHLARLEPTIEILKTISDTKFDTDTAYVEMLLMHSLLCLMTQKEGESLDFLGKAQRHMDNSSKISNNKRSLFQVFIDQQSIKLILEEDHDSEVIRAHRQSLSQNIKKLTMV